MFFSTLRFLHISLFRLIGLMLFYVLRNRRAIAKTNLNFCFPAIKQNKSFNKNKVIKTLTKKSFINLGQTLGDFFFLKFYNNKNIDKYVEIKNIHYLKEAMSNGKGIILSSAHFGSWELAAHCLALKGFKSLIVHNQFRTLAFLNNFIKSQREFCGNNLVDKQNCFIKIYKRLKAGKIVTIVTDQYATETDGEFVPFLGKNSLTHKIFAQMSLKTGAPIICSFIFTLDPSKYVIEINKPIDPLEFKDKPNATYLMLKKHNEILENAIKRSPENWMWQHKRFKGVVEY